MPVRIYIKLRFLILTLILYCFPGHAVGHLGPKIGNLCRQLLSPVKFFKGVQNSMMNANDVIQQLGLTPLPGEGGFYREIYRAPYKIGDVTINGRILRDRVASTSIYYMVTPQTFSSLHRLPQDEIFHFYMGEPVEMLVIHQSGSHELITLGPDPSKGHRSQFIVPGGSWQGTRLARGNSNFALLGTTVSPGFEFVDMELMSRAELLQMFPQISELVKRYTVEH